MRAQNSLLQIYDFKTGRAEVIARFDKVIEAPNWSPDGAKLFFNSEGKLFSLELSSREVTHIDTGVATTVNNDHVLSRDGTKIAISSGIGDSWESRIFIKDLISGSVRCVVEKTPSYLHGWSPDGKLLAYCAARYAGAPELEWDVYVTKANPEPGAAFEERRLTFSYGLNDGPEFSADGQHLWFNSVRSGRMQVFRMDIDGKNQTQMTFDTRMNAWFPHISPDGRRVVYIAYHQEDLGIGEHLPDKNVEIRFMDPNHPGEEQTLIQFFGGQGSMNVNSWAPDSERFAFVGYEA